MNLKYFDIHSHLNFSQFDEDRGEILQKMQDEGIGTICVGTGRETSKESVELAEKYPHIWATVGMHPTSWEEDFDQESFKSLLEGKSSEKVVGIGETGLDYYREQEHKREQRELFEAQIQLANNLELPLMLHGRPSAGSMDAYDDMLDILRSTLDNSLLSTGHVHFFAGDVDVAQKFLDLGFTIGFDGPITFTHDYDEVVEYVPIERLCVETDAPFAAPAPYRGKRNSPLYVPYIVEAVAGIKRLDAEVVRRASVENAVRVFRLS